MGGRWRSRCSIGVLVGVFNDVSDPLAAALLVMGVIWWLDGRTAAAAIAALAACLLARELYMLPVAVLAVAELWSGRGAPASCGSIPLACSRPGRGTSASPSRRAPPRAATARRAVPLRGMFQKARDVLREDVIGAANWEIAFLAFVLACWVYFAVRSLAALRRLDRAPSREELLPLVGLGALFLFPFLTDELLARTSRATPATGPRWPGCS